MNIYNQIAEMVKKTLTPQQIVKFLPVILELVGIALNKGQGKLTPESAIAIQDELEKLRNRK